MTPEAVARQAEMLGNRVAKTQRKLRTPMEQQGIGAYRLYDRDIPEIRAAVDWYEGHLVLAEYARTQTDNVPGWLAAMGEGCAKALGLAPDRIHLKRRRTRPKEGERYARLDQRSVRLQVREGPLKFWVNLTDYIDTGLFPDHRKTRARVFKEAAGKRFLNLFGYTGSFTCAAAVGGAKSSETVDASGTYLEWARDNLALNQQAKAQHATVRSEAVTFLDRAAAEGRRWELAVLDPPSFTDRGPDGEGLDVLRDHPMLIAKTLAVLDAGGVLYFSTNHQRFEPSFEGLPARSIREITQETVPGDYRNAQAHRCFRLEV